MERVGKMIKWFRDHPWLTALSVISLISSIPLFAIEATRANIVVTVWSIFTLGLVVTIVITERGEGIQRRAWLRANSRAIGPFLWKLAGMAGLTAMEAIGLRDETGQALRWSRDLRARRDGLQAAHRIAGSFKSDPLVEDPKKMKIDFTAWIDRVVETSTDIDATVESDGPDMNRLPELRVAIRQFRDAVSLAQNLTRFFTPNLGVSEIIQRSLRAYVTEGALAICDQCADLFDEAPALVPK